MIVLTMLRSQLARSVEMGLQQVLRFVSLSARLTSLVQVAQSICLS